MPALEFGATYSYAKLLFEAAAGRLREGMMIGYDTDRMKGLWPTEDMVPDYKSVLLVALCTAHKTWAAPRSGDPIMTA